MGAAPVRFENVSKRFLKGESATALRDLIPKLVRKIRGKSVGPVDREFWALKDVSFEVGEGEVLGLIGANGAGKSTTLKLVAGILRANAGVISVNGTLSALIEVAAGFHPDLTGRENIFLNGSVLGLKRRIIKERLEEIIDFAELRDFIDTPVKRYSSGMHMRLGFAVAVHVDPQILLIDEVLAVGDLAFRRKCLARIQDLKERGKTILFVSHKMFDVRSICDRVIFLKDGGIYRDGNAVDVTKLFEREMLEKSLAQVVGQAQSQRAGGSKVTIIDVEATDLEGREVEAIRTGDPLRVRVRMDAGEPVDGPILSVALLRSDGRRVCVATTRILGPEIKRFEGHTEFEVVFDRLDLIEEYYTVETVIWNKEMSIPVAQYVNPTVRVSDDCLPLNRPGIFHPRARFVRVSSRDVNYEADAGPVD
jgi:homopolymeric O-antigen transport system ATP-binding protein